MTIRLKRVYEPPEASDGVRILVDRLWPRGLARDKAQIDLWLKDLSPSNELRKRFHGHPEDWEAFRLAYATELQAPLAGAALAQLRDRARQGIVTLLYAARDERHNNAVALKAWLGEHPDGA